MLIIRKNIKKICKVLIVNIISICLLYLNIKLLYIGYIKDELITHPNIWLIFIVYSIFSTSFCATYQIIDDEGLIAKIKDKINSNEKIKFMAIDDTLSENIFTILKALISYGIFYNVLIVSCTIVDVAIIINIIFKNKIHINYNNDF